MGEKRGCAAFASNEKIRPTVLSTDHDLVVRIAPSQLPGIKKAKKHPLKDYLLSGWVTYTSTAERLWEFHWNVGMFTLAFHRNVGMFV